MAEYADASEADLIVSNDAEIATTSRTRYSLNHDSKSDDNGQINEADKGIYLGDENKANNKTSRNHTRAEERSNKVKKKGGEIEKVENNHDDAHKSKDSVENEEERERVRGYRSKLRKIDNIRKPVEVGEYGSYITKVGAK